MDLQQLYKKLIYNRCQDLLASGKEVEIWDNFDLSKIFEYFSCIQLTEQFGKQFYAYDNIPIDFKTENRMSRCDTGIDLCNLVDTIVQCKLRKKNLFLNDLGTFLSSQVVFSEELGKPVVRWEKMVLVRNEESVLSRNVREKIDFKLVTDITYKKDLVKSYCKDLIASPPVLQDVQEEFVLRDYQKDCIEMITGNKQNSVICLPTGCGKNSVMIFSMKVGLKYLVLVPRIVLMEQFYEEICSKRPEFRNDIQCIGDGNNVFDERKKITICVFNSVGLVEDFARSFEKIFVDEAHHICKPEIYCVEEDFSDGVVDQEEDSDLEGFDSESECFDSDEESVVSEDDSQDELKVSLGYMKMIRRMKKFNNNVYLSATIDEQDGFLFYKKEIREMIDKKWLSDYLIHVPIFSENATNKNVCSYLVENYRNIIIFCSNHKEGHEINDLMNAIQPNCSAYIDCNTRKLDRDNILNKFREGRIPFLVNVRVLCEGFDAPITKGVCFMHMPHNKTLLIQILGRCLRRHFDKDFANVILPFSCNEDEKSIVNFMKTMAYNDSKLKKVLKEKKTCGYFCLEKCFEKDDVGEFEAFLRYDKIYDSFGKFLNEDEIWLKRLEDLKEFIDMNKRRPSSESCKFSEKKLGRWLLRQVKNYDDAIYKNKITKHIKILEQFFKEYKIYFLSKEETWDLKLDELKKFIEINNKTPLTNSINKIEKKIASWLGIQKENYLKKTDGMKSEKRREKWEIFINQYEKFLETDEQKWYRLFKVLKDFIDTNKKLPSEKVGPEDEKKIARWLSTQKKNFLLKQDGMKNEDRYKSWENFLIDYNYYIKDEDKNWLENLEKLRNFIKTFERLPTELNKDTDDEKPLCKWISHQLQNYKKKQKCMKEPEKYYLFTDFLNEFHYYFRSKDEIWDQHFESLKKFVKVNDRLPKNNDTEKLLFNWLRSQRSNYKNKKCALKDTIKYELFGNYMKENKEYF